MMFVKHLLLLFLIDIFSYTLCHIGLCYNNGRFCCDNFEMKEGKCVECGLGYTSFSKQLCVQCLSNTYGKRCAERCACSAAERCDHVRGCVNSSGAVNNSTDTIIEVTFTQQSLKTTGYRKHNDSSMQPSHKTRDHREHNDSSLKPISIYSISVASLTFMLVIGITLIVYGRRYTVTERQRRDTQEQNTQPTSQTVER